MLRSASTQSVASAPVVSSTTSSDSAAAVATSPNKPDQPSSEAIINLGAAPILGLGAPPHGGAAFGGTALQRIVTQFQSLAGVTAPGLGRAQA